jgi:hypothetical protein
MLTRPTAMMLLTTIAAVSAAPTTVVVRDTTRFNATIVRMLSPTEYRGEAIRTSDPPQGIAILALDSSIKVDGRVLTDTIAVAVDLYSFFIPLGGWRESYCGHNFSFLLIDMFLSDAPPRRFVWVEALTRTAAMDGRAALPARGSVVVIPQNHDNTAGDVFIRDPVSGAQVFFMPIPGVLGGTQAYLNGHVYVNRRFPGTKKGAQIWRYDTARKGIVVDSTAYGLFEVSPSDKYLALSIDSVGIRIMRADGSGVVKEISNRTLGLDSLQELRSVWVEGWNAASTELWYCVEAVSDESTPDTLGCIAVPGWGITKYPLPVRLIRYQLNPTTKRVVYYVYPATGKAVGVCVYDVVARRSTSIGTTLLGGENPFWKNDSTACIVDSKTGKEYNFSTTKP